VGRVTILAWLFAALICGMALGEGEETDTKTKGRPSVTVPSAPPPSVSGVLESDPSTVRVAVPADEPVRPILKRRELSLKQARELGLSLPNLVAVAKELRAEGEIDDSTSRAEKVAAITVRLHDKNPQAFSLGNVDWDAVFEFIDRLMGLIEKIMGRATAMTNDGCGAIEIASWSSHQLDRVQL
jgi:hypothetical protein